MQAGPTGRLGIVGERGFGCYWSARTLSLIGDYAFRTAFATHIITVSGSASVLATATAVLLLPSLLFYLVGGAVGDRAGSRRRIMVSADAARFLTLVLIVLSTLWTDSVPLLVVLAALIGIADGFFQPVAFAYMLEITPKEKLVAANSALSVSQQIGLIGGPLLGGFLVSFAGAPWTFAFDSLTFLLSGVLLLAIGKAPAATAAGPAGSAGQGDSAPAGQDGQGDQAGTSEDKHGADAGSGRLRQLLGDVSQGLSYVRGVHWLLISIVVGACTNAVYAGVLDVAVPLLMAPNGARDAGSLGAFYTLQGVGALLGAAVLVKLTVRRLGVTLYLMLALMACSLAAAGLIGGGNGALAMAVLYGVGLHFFNSLFPSLLQGKVPEHLMGRVGSFALLGFNALMPLGALLMGPLIAVLDAGDAALTAGVAAGCVSLAALLSPSIRRLATVPSQDAGPEPAGAELPTPAGPGTDAAPAR
ncbi:MFS transporter [Kitasatospora sp. NPDC096128]|uniref:MFS transporter n=1 Tax=Kitasatospora sp. NPDC096128 TaxID=3155547 RepID=UPI00332E9639